MIGHTTWSRKSERSCCSWLHRALSRLHSPKDCRLSVLYGTSSAWYIKPQGLPRIIRVANSMMALRPRVRVRVRVLSLLLPPLHHNPHCLRLPQHKRRISHLSSPLDRCRHWRRRCHPGCHSPALLHRASMHYRSFKPALYRSRSSSCCCIVAARLEGVTGGHFYCRTVGPLQSTSSAVLCVLCA